MPCYHPTRVRDAAIIADDGFHACLSSRSKLAAPRVTQAPRMREVRAPRVWGSTPSCPSCAAGASPGLCAAHHHTSRDRVCAGPADWPPGGIEEQESPFTPSARPRPSTPCHACGPARRRPEERVPEASSALSAHSGVAPKKTHMAVRRRRLEALRDVAERLEPSNSTRDQ